MEFRLLSVTLRPLNVWYPFNMTLCGPQSRSGGGASEKLAGSCVGKEASCPPKCGKFIDQLRKYYRCADKFLARPASRCILFDGENISFDASRVIYINSTNIPPIMIINMIYETQYLLSL